MVGEHDFTCDFCGQNYYTDEDVDAEPVYLGEPPTPDPVVAQGSVPKMGRDEDVYGKVAAYRSQEASEATAINDGVQVLGRPLDEVTAILDALNSHEQLDVTTSPMTVEVNGGFDDFANEKLDRMLDEEQDPNHIPTFQAEEKRQTSVQVVAEPTPHEREPDAVVCEYCHENITDE